jgi:hypothetical protein
MAKVWAAKCPSCGKLSGVRPSASGGNQIDLQNPSEKFDLGCPHCSARNSFTGGDLTEVDASILSSTPK